MSQSLAKILIHTVFSTKERLSFLLNPASKALTPDSTWFKLQTDVWVNDR